MATMNESRRRAVVVTLAILSTAVWVGPRGVAAGGPPPVLDRHADVSGHRIHYLESGSGPAVVLVHGLGADSRTWRQLISELSTGFHVFAIDQLGFGQSDKPQVPYHVGLLAENLAGFLDAVGVQKASIVGNSLGGWVAVRFATQYPDRLDKLVLVDAAGYGEEPAQMVRDYLSRLDPATVAGVERFLGSMTPEQQSALEMMAAMYFARQYSRGDGYAVAALVESILRGEDVLGPEIKTIHAPTLVIWGRNDPVIPLRVGEALAADIPGASKEILDGCGHRPQTQCAGVFNTDVRRFLSGY
jgi:pimeloyl-ACP methyl ester carboxylesterase